AEFHGESLNQLPISNYQPPRGAARTIWAEDGSTSLLRRLLPSWSTYSPWELEIGRWELTLTVSVRSHPRRPRRRPVDRPQRRVQRAHDQERCDPPRRERPGDE